jgi:predicted CoA-binding protein
MSIAAPRSEAERIDALLASGSFAVVGASTDRYKYGNKVLRCYQQHGRKVCPAISVITPPAATEQVVGEAHAAGVKHVWMQPGAESDDAIRTAEALGMNVVADGPCLLVVMGHREHG